MITSLACVCKTQLLWSLDGYSLMSNYTLILMTSLILSDITVGTSAAHKELPRDDSKAEETHPRVSVTDTGVASYLCAMGRTMFPLTKMEVEFWSTHNQFLYVSRHPFSTHTSLCC